MELLLIIDERTGEAQVRRDGEIIECIHSSYTEGLVKQLNQIVKSNIPKFNLKEMSLRDKVIDAICELDEKEGIEDLDEFVTSYCGSLLDDGSVLYADPCSYSNGETCSLRSFLTNCCDASELELAKLLRGYYDKPKAVLLDEYDLEEGDLEFTVQEALKDLYEDLPICCNYVKLENNFEEYILVYDMGWEN